MKTRIVAVLCCVFMITSLLAGCGVDNREAIRIGDIKVTKGEFAFHLEAMKELLIQELNLEIDDEASWSTVEIENKKAIDVAKDKALEDVVKNAVQVQKAKELGIKLDENDRKAMGRNKNSFIQAYGGTDKFNELLAKCNLDLAGFEKILENYAYANKLRLQTITDPNFVDYTDEQLKETHARNTARVKHILVLFEKEDGTVLSNEEAKAQAQALLDRAKAGESFDMLMEEYSEDPGKVQYPEGYTFPKQNSGMVKEFTEASFALSIGDISEPVETQFGYHIIKRFPVEDLDSTFEEAKMSLLEALSVEKYNDLVEEWKDAAEIVKNDAILALFK